jgi:hypothetical protein
MKYQHEILAVPDEDGYYCQWCNTGISACPGCGETFHNPELDTNEEGFCQDCIEAEKVN